MGKEVTIGDLTLDIREAWSPFRGMAVNREEKVGEISGSLLKGPDQLLLEVSHIRWEDGSEEVKATNLINGPNRFQNVVNRHMMSIRELNGYKFAEVSLTKLALDGKAGKIQCGIHDWNIATGIDVNSFLINHGAVEIGTRENLEGVSNNRRNYLSVKLNLEDSVAPVLVWVLSKAVPVYNQYGLATN